MLSQLAKVVQEPYRLRGHLNHRLTGINKYYRTISSPDGFPGQNHMDKEWDVLLLLDATRYDIYCDVVSEEAQLCRSVASMSNEFIRNTFQGRKLHDTVYLTDNPYAALINDEVFYHLRMVEMATNNQTIPPREMGKRAKDIASEFPDKRLIVHFMQPHDPYFGPSGCNLPTQRFWQKARAGKVPVSQLNAAYRENLKLVADIAFDVAESVTGKTIISSDHGELLGDRGYPIPIREFGHPEGYYRPELVHVPWHNLGGEKRAVVAESPITDFKAGEQTVESRLESLGYI